MCTILEQKTSPEVLTFYFASLTTVLKSHFQATCAGISNTGPSDGRVSSWFNNFECSLKNVCLAFNPSASAQLITRLLAVAGTHRPAWTYYNLHLMVND
jgi:hypothetical protein